MTVNKQRLFRYLLPVLGRTRRLSFPIAGRLGPLALLHGPTRRRLYANYGPLCASDRARTKKAAGVAISGAAQYYVDLASLRYRNMREFAADGLEIDDEEKRSFLERSGPRIVVGGHTVGAELTLRALPEWGRPFTALVEHLNPDELSEFMVGWRTAPGAKYVTTERRGLRECLSTLKDGGLVTVMADRDIQGNGVEVTFFGRKVRFPRGPWELAARTGAEVIPVLSARGPSGRIRVSIQDTIEIDASGDRETCVAMAAQAWATVLERHLVRDPGQWIVLEDFWRTHGNG